MADTTSAAAPGPAAPATPAPSTTAPTAAPLKKVSLVRVNRQAYASSLEAAASDEVLPAYVQDGPGEILAVKGAYAQLRWRRPVPDVWLRLDQLEAYSGS
ncbi:MAG: NAD(P)H-quinone oxidoreductase subunit O [Cyanobacteriota bacterium]